MGDAIGQINMISTEENNKPLVHRGTRLRYLKICPKQNCEINMHHNQTSQDRSN
jgi:hypothetical protein